MITTERLSEITDALARDASDCDREDADEWLKSRSPSFGLSRHVGALQALAADTEQAGVLTISEAGYLADVLRGVERRKRMRWYPLGSDTNAPAVLVLRAFTNPDGTFYPVSADIRDAHVWVSGIFERWLPVREVLAALANAMDGTDDTAPMAIIDEPAA